MPPQPFPLPPGATPADSSGSSSAGGTDTQQFPLPAGATAVAPSQPAQGTLSGLLNGAPGSDLAKGKQDASNDITGFIKNTLSPRGIWDSIPAVQFTHQVEQIFPLIHQYEKSRSSGASVGDSLRAVDNVARQHMLNIAPVQSVVDAFKANPTRATARTLIDASTAAATLLLGGGAGADAEAATTDAVVPTTTTAEAASAEAASAPARPNPFRQRIEQVAARNAAKAPISAGAEAVTEGPTVSDVQPQVQGAIRSSADAAAQDAGLRPVDPSTPIRQVYQDVGDQLQARSKATYAQIKSVTGVDIKDDLLGKIKLKNTGIQNAITNGDEELAGKLEQERIGLENQVGDAMTKAKAAGIDVDSAAADWKRYKASYDINNHVVGSTSGVSGIGEGEQVDPNKLSPRLQRASIGKTPGRPGRLQEFMGDDSSQSLRNAVEQSRVSITQFEPTTATGQRALQDILQSNTGKGWLQTAKQSFGFAPKTDYIGSFRDFNKMPTEDATAQFGDEAPEVGKYLQKQALWQVGKMVAKGATLEGIAHLTGADKALLHLIFSSGQ
jgi:hypothetical protein